MKKIPLFLCVLMFACGGNGTGKIYQQDQTSINEKPDSAFTIAMKMDGQSVSCHISKDCSSTVAQLADISTTMSEIQFHFETINAGATSVEITCTGTTDVAHTYNIVVAE